MAHLQLVPPPAPVPREPDAQGKTDADGIRKALENWARKGDPSRSWAKETLETIEEIGGVEFLAPFFDCWNDHGLEVQICVVLDQHPGSYSQAIVAKLREYEAKRLVGGEPASHVVGIFDHDDGRPILTLLTHWSTDDQIGRARAFGWKVL